MNFYTKLISVFSVISIVFGDKKVCKSFTDYLTIDLNPNCFYSGDVDAPPEKIAAMHGYFMQRTELVSSDGYLLDLYHLVKHSRDLLNDRPPVLIQHSIFSNVKTFMANQNKSLAFAFLDKGYDVWLSSFRVIQRKEGHVNMSSYDPEYWKFSYYEMATRDLPVFIDHVRKNNNSTQKVIYLGHNQGSTLGYIYASLKPEEAQQNLKALFSLGSFAFANYVRSPFIRLGLMKVFAIFGTNFLTRAFYDDFVMPYGDVLAQTLCYGIRNVVGCKILMDLLINGGHSEFDPEYFPTFIYTLKPILPYMAKDIQYMYETGKFEGTDYKSSDTNPKRIKYPLENIRVPVYIFDASNDAVSDLKDAKKLLGKLTNTKSKLIVVDDDLPVKLLHTDSFVSKGLLVYIEKMFKELDNMDS